MAKASQVPVQPVAVFPAGALLKIAASLNDQQNLQCLKITLDELEYDADEHQDLDNAWAHGDVMEIKARYRASAVKRCLMLVPSANQLVEDDVAAATYRLWAELQKPGKTVAVIDMAWLLPEGGIVDRLRARGALVIEPRALASKPSPVTAVQ